MGALTISPRPSLRAAPSSCVATFQTSSAKSPATSATERPWAASFRRPLMTYRAYARTMKTGVPTRTRLNSHSASGIRMRTHPWDAE